MSNTQQPEALQLAELCDKYRSLEKFGAELRSQHARIAELEAQLSAIGAGGVEPLRKRAASEVLAAQEENQVDRLFDAVLNCPHSITAESVTLHFYPRQKEGHNALAQLHHRLAAYDQEARQREMQLLGEIEALERLALANLKQRESRSAVIDSASRIQKYLDRLATAKQYDKECIHSFGGKDGETPLLVADLKALLQFASAAISTTTHPADEQLDDINVADMSQVFDLKGAA